MSPTTAEGRGKAQSEDRVPSAPKQRVEHHPVDVVQLSKSSVNADLLRGQQRNVRGPHGDRLGCDERLGRKCQTIAFGRRMTARF